jgi:hypothetical protein
MADQNTPPAPGPASAAPAPAAPAPQPGQAPGTPPAAGTPPQDKVEIDAKELNKLKRKAGRWDALNGGGGQNRPSRTPDQRTTPTNDDDDDQTPEAIRERDRIIQEKDAENVLLKLSNNVRDLFERPEYKDVPASIKKAITRNPQGFVLPTSKNLEHQLEDIQTYLDDELDNLGSSGTPGSSAPAPTPAPTNQTPPASGSGPSPTGKVEMDSIEGKKGAARSTTVLKNLFSKARNQT